MNGYEKKKKYLIAFYASFRHKFWILRGQWAVLCENVGIIAWGDRVKHWVFRFTAKPKTAN